MFCRQPVHDLNHVQAACKIQYTLFQLLSLPMFALDNFTCFHAQNFMNIDQTDRGYHVIVAKVGYTFEIDAQTGHTQLALTAVQPPLVFADQYHYESSLSSTKVESDFVLYKPKLDVIIHAQAYAPMGRASAYFPVSVTIGDYQKNLIISGPRYWQRESFGWTLSKATPIMSLPIHYEYAFGGSGSETPYAQSGHDGDDNDMTSQDILHNPIGRGFYSESYLSSVPRKRLFIAHQIDNPSTPIIHPSALQIPQGLGCFARYFADRLCLSGTANTHWIQNRAPLLPENFSMSYWNGAHPDLQFNHFKANHLYDFVLTGLTPESIAPKQTFRFQLPVETLFVYIQTDNHLSLCRDLVLDTVWIDVEEKRIDCTYRRAFAEEIGIQTAELRYISRHERGAQIELAKEMAQQKQTMFIPLPPSLASL